MVRIWAQQQVYCLRISTKEGLVYTASSGQVSARESLRLLHIADRIAWDFLLAFRAVGEDGVTRRFLILNDRVSPAEFRRLRVFLRWSGRRYARKKL